MSKIYVTVVDMVLEDFDELEYYRESYPTLGFNIVVEEGPAGWPEVEVFGPIADLVDFLEDNGYVVSDYINRVE